MLPYRRCLGGFAAPHTGRLSPRLLSPLPPSLSFSSSLPVPSQRSMSSPRAWHPPSRLQYDSGLVDGAPQPLGRPASERPGEYNTNAPHDAPDPYLVAQEVRSLLRREQYDKAYKLVCAASIVSTKMFVSWNHLIEYQMSRGAIRAAVSCYNNMKKRSQRPNPSTYTIIFSGCAKSLHPRQAVSEATRIYKNMLQDGARIRPNTIHMNAVLSVCARAGDMTALFETLSTADKTRVPDATTYSIIFHGLRHRADHDTKKNFGLVDVDAKREVENRIKTAMKLWDEACQEWKRGALAMDEIAVSSLCRLLTTGSYWANSLVLGVLEDAMLVPRFDMPNTPVPATAPPNNAPPAPADNPRPPRPTAAIHHPTPSSKTLSIVLTALANTRKTASAPKYWSYFTQTLGVAADTDNYICYLRALEVGHASAQAANLVETMPKHFLAISTFRRALVVCKRDHLNPDAFKHASRIFNAMLAALRYPDNISLRLFLQVARGNIGSFTDGEKEEKQGAEEGQHVAPAPAPISAVPSPGQLAHGRQLAAAIDLMWEPFRRLSQSLSYPEAPSESPAEERKAQADEMSELMGTARRMMTALDAAIEKTLPTDTEALRQLRTRRNVLQRQVERWVLTLFPQGEPVEFKAAANEELGEGPAGLKAAAEENRFRRSVKPNMPRPPNWKPWSDPSLNRSRAPRM